MDADAARQLLVQYFTEEELALLTPAEVRFLALLAKDALPVVPTEASLRRQAEYRTRIEYALSGQLQSRL